MSLPEDEEIPSVAPILLLERNFLDTVPHGPWERGLLLGGSFSSITFLKFFNLFYFIMLC